MKITMKVVVCLLIFLSITQATFATEVFTRYLQKGDSGSDVLILQKLLNKNNETQVSESGAGSPGNETNFFGEATKQAVIDYQKINDLGNQMGFFTIYSGAVDEKTQKSLNSDTSKLAQNTQTECKKPRESALPGGVLSSFFSPLVIQESFNQKKIDLHKGMMSGGVAEKWISYNRMGQIDIPPLSKQPFITHIDVIKSVKSILPTPKEVLEAPKNNIKALISGQLPTPLIDMPGVGNSMVFEEGDVLKIYGCNFGSSVIVHFSYDEIRASSKEGGTLVEVEIKSQIQKIIDGALNGFEDEDRTEAIKAMQGFLTMPTSQGVPGVPQSGQQNNNQQQQQQRPGGGIIPQVLGATTDVLKALPVLSSLPGVSQLINMISNNDSSKPKETPFTGGQQMPGIPVFITVENSNGTGVSNGYQMYFKPH